MRQLLAGMSPRLGVNQVPHALPVGLHFSIRIPNSRFEFRSVIPAHLFLFCDGELEFFFQPPHDEVWNQSLNTPA